MRYLLAFALSAAPILAQALISNTLAISSGSVAGSYAGKGIQKNLSTIFSKTNETLELGGKQGFPKWNTSPEALTPTGANMPPAPESTPGARRTIPGKSLGKGAPTRSYAYEANTAPLAPLPPFLAPIVEPPPFQPVSREMLAEIVTGTPREELVARLGTPASRVSIPGSGGLEEIYYYTHAGEILGAVRVMDNSVTRVDINR
jgi:hypothetical protein